MGVQQIMNGFSPLTLLMLLPLFGGCVLLGLEKHQRAFTRHLAFGVSLLTLALALFIGSQFDSTSGELQMVERHAWMPSLGVEYFVGVDGLSLVLLLLTALLVPMSMLAAWKLEERTSMFFALILFLQGGLFGTFTALNFIHWFLFWELSLVPAFFLVKLWGGPERGKAAIQFFVYTMVGSVTLLLAFLGMYLAVGTFDFIKLAELAKSGELLSRMSLNLGWYELKKEQLGLVIAFGVFLGLAVKVPLMPFHGWLPRTYSTAPAAVTMLLTGAMSKMGVYGFLRIFLPIFQEQIAFVQNWLLWLAIATIVMSALAASAQTDLKKLLAYSSINHLGYCLLGIFATASSVNGHGWTVEASAALGGTVLQMFNHGITAALLFCFVSYLEERGAGETNLSRFGGLRAAMPVFCGLMGVATFASLGLPGLSGFVGEFLIFKGTFGLAAWAAVLATPGLLITAIFLLRMYQQIFYGPLPSTHVGWRDLDIRERFTVLPALLLVLILGVYPQLLMGLINPTVTRLVEGLAR
ncbi:MAG TPA: NADH-quinone oxidoreductase subunit M [Verrucomicrobiae bacterium]